jgi:hypothetical protein
LLPVAQSGVEYQNAVVHLSIMDARDKNLPRILLGERCARFMPMSKTEPRRAKSPGPSRNRCRVSPGW